MHGGGGGQEKEDQQEGDQQEQEVKGGGLLHVGWVVSTELPRQVDQQVSQTLVS